MIEKPIYIITFNSANSSTALYKLLKESKLQVSIAQTPCCLSAGCARSIVVKEPDIEKSIALIKNSTFDVRAIHKKYVDLKTRRYVYEEISF